jgi:fructokinase
LLDRIGIDLGGTKIEGIVLDAKGNISQRLRVATPKDDYDATLDALAHVTSQLDVPTSTPLGICTPGAVSLVTGLMKNCNSTCLNNKPLREDLEHRLARPVRIANDADCFALSEASDGSARGNYSVFGVILGTGVGGGICIEQKLIHGVSAICGEWGHNPLPLNALQQDPRPPIGRACYCGRQDCVESWLSGPAFEKRFSETFGESLSARQIVERASSGDESAHGAVDQYHHLLALALATLINILDPETIVIGGGMSNIESIYTGVPAYLKRYVFSDDLNTRIVPAMHGDSSGVRGAAWLWP